VSILGALTGFGALWPVDFQDPVFAREYPTRAAAPVQEFAWRVIETHAATTSRYERGQRYVLGRTTSRQGKSTGRLSAYSISILFGAAVGSRQSLQPFIEMNHRG